MTEHIKKYWIASPRIRKITGVILIIIGTLSILTPFTPVGFLLLVGLEILGARVVVTEKVKKWFKI